MTRAKLNFGMDDEAEAPPPVDPAAIRAASQAAGFRSTSPEPVQTPPAGEGAPARRSRRKTGRVHQFNTRLRVETVKAIQDYADKHELDSMAEVIERAMDALSREEAAS